MKANAILIVIILVISFVYWNSIDTMKKNNVEDRFITPVHFATSIILIYAVAREVMK